MKFLIIAMLAAGCIATTTVSAADDPVVVLPPFRVDEFSSYLGFAWNAVLKNEKITTVRFSRVEPRSLAARAGLMENDHLVAIDGHPVAGLEVKELQQLFSRNWKPGDTLKWDFTVERGALFTRRQTITVRMKTKAADSTTTGER